MGQKHQTFKSIEKLIRNIQKLADIAQDKTIQTIYHQILSDEIEYAPFVDHVRPDNGRYWMKLAGATTNIEHIKQFSLNEWFLDKDVKTLLQFVYGQGYQGSKCSAEAKQFASG